jgi:hypothetical protein
MSKYRFFFAGVVCGIVILSGWLAATVGRCAESMQSRMESDWLRQDLPQKQASKGGISTQSDAAGGVDGVKNGKWGFHTSDDVNPWWQVDLGKAGPLDRVVIFNASHLPTRAAHLKVLLSADGKSWREVYAHDGTPFVGATDKKPLVVPLHSATARLVRIQLPGRQWLHLDEVEVYGQADPKRNIALGQPADQSSTSQWSVAHLVLPPQPTEVSYPIEQVLERGQKLLAERRRQAINVDASAQAFESLAARLKTVPADLKSPQRRELYLQAHAEVRRLVLANPLLNIDKLLFVKRYTYHSSHIYTDYFDGSSQVGGNLCVLSPVAPDGKVTELVPQLNGGIFGRFDLSFDARKVVFAYKKPGRGYRIYEVGIDGAGLRQITQDADDEAELVKQFHHGYDDLDPCYLPDGKIMFVSTRSRRAVLCHNSFTTSNLFVMTADGKKLECVSGNTTSEFTPSMMNDGRVLYTRWEYVDKGCGDVQSLWSMRPDGSGAAHVYKNNVALPSTLIDARCIPDSHRLIAVGAPHMPLAVGPLVLIDIHITQLTPAAMTNLTPEIGYPPHAGYPGAKFGFYKEPYPLSENVFLVCYNPGPLPKEPAGYGIYVFDTTGGRELLYQDPVISSFQPIPLRPRPVPPIISAIASREDHPAKDTATLFMADVYEGLTGIARGTVKYVRIMEDTPKPWEPGYGSPSRGDSCGLQNPVISLNGHFTVKKLHGVVRVEQDGSAYFRVPAGKNLYFQALDEKYMELQRMRTFVNLMPGEHRSCIGCHESRKHTPAVRTGIPIALGQPIQTIMPQPGDHGLRTVHYPVDVQPVLDKYCLSCHSGAKAQAQLDLSSDPTTQFCVSYENLIRRRLVNNIDVNPRSAYIPAEPPLTFGSHRSKMIEKIQNGPCKANLTQEEFVRLVTWIDSNAPYYGNYEGKRNLRWKGLADFRPNPKIE